MNKGYLGDNYFLHNETAIKLYNEYAANTPIFDYHCHLNPKAIYENKPFENLTQAWIIENGAGDHYKWRLMRGNGVAEKYITGDATDYEKFLKFAETVERAIGNPIYQWSHMELYKYFGIEEDLNSKTAPMIYEKANEILKTLTPRKMIEMSNVKIVCTTDDPVDSLEYHKLIKEDKSFNVKVLPAWRPDKAVNIHLSWFNEWMDKLEKVVSKKFDSVNTLLDALRERMAFFKEMGTKVSDHALEDFVYTDATYEEVNAIFLKRRSGAEVTELERSKYQTYLMKFFGEEYSKLGWVQQYHIGAYRNVNVKMFKKLGPDTGYDAFSNESYIKSLCKLMSALNEKDALPKTILYSLNQLDNMALITLGSTFSADIRGKIQLGAAWWFNDQKDGIRRHLDELSQIGMIANFVGMLTDSRSFLSYPRHDYFRRILCDFLGELVEGHEFPNDLERVGKIVEDICYNNAIEYFEMK